jgi:hypothetical protein
MQNHFNLKHVALLLGLLMPAVWCGAHGTISMDGYSQIIIKENNLHGIPKGNTIQASLDGHWLSVTFTQDIGTLTMELEMVSGPVIFNYPTVQTPDSYQFYLNQTGDYIITFTLSNGDEYYGEFTITN